MGRKRVVIVQRGATELLRALQERFGADPDTEVFTDRRVHERRRASRTVSSDRRRCDRRQPLDATALVERGFFVTVTPRARRERASASR